ncbi:complement component C6, partial [Tachysurus ichikawai]
MSVLHQEIVTSTFQTKSSDLYLSHPFLTFLTNLPLDYNYALYRQIFQQFGTHYFSSGSLGGRYDLLFQYSREELKTQGLTQEQKKSCIQNEFSVFLFIYFTSSHSNRCGTNTQTTKYEGSFLQTSEKSISSVKGGRAEYAAALAWERKGAPPDSTTYKDWISSTIDNPTVIDYELKPLVDLVRGIPCAVTKRRHMLKALDEYLASFDSCKCAPCPNNGRPTLVGTECVCICQTGTYGANCEKRAKDYTSEAVDGYWSCWSSWSACDSTLKKHRTRSCNNPAPQKGGKPCQGPEFQEEECSISIFQEKDVCINDDEFESEGDSESILPSGASGCAKPKPPAHSYLRDIMMDNKVPESCKHTKTVALEEIHADSQAAETKAGQIHSTVLSCSKVVVDLSPESCEGPTRRERFKSDLQQASQEITILVTNHESPETEMEENECIGESDTDPEFIVPIEEDSLDVSKVVADLIELSQMQETCLISNSSAEQSTSTDAHNLPNTDECRESHKGETRAKSQYENKSQSEEGVISSDSEDLKRSEETVSNVAINQGKSLEKSNSDWDMLPRQQQHIQTQVSLEVIYHSAATSPMTPPEGSTAFFFPYCLNKLGNGSELVPVETKDAELAVQTCSVATAPMTPVATNAPKQLVETRSIATAPMTPITTIAPELQVKTHSVATAPMTPITTIAPGLQIESRSVATAPMTPVAKTAPELQIETHSVATAPMTPTAKTAPDLQVETRSVATAPMTPIATRAPELRVETRSISTAPMTPIATRAPELRVETRSIATAPMTPIATRAPELQVETRSIATAPMTPIATRAPELRVETRSIATAPMTPIATRAPELQVETRSSATAPMSPIILSSPELIPEPEPRVMPCSEDPPEPVQELCWDEKGMTWEVYGAMVEVSVLGSAIQKHLEKQVLKKQIKPHDTSSNQTLPLYTTDTSTPIHSTPPALSASSRCSSAKGSRKKDERKGKRGRQRRNPIRLFFRNFRRPNCCSRVHAD